MELAASNKTTMNSYFFLKNIVNPARLEAGENKVRNDDFLRRVEDEIDDLGGVAKLSQPTGTKLNTTI